MLEAEGVDMVFIDTAHGHTKGVVDAVRSIKDVFPELSVVAGNVVTTEGVQCLVDAGADVVKVGVGAGSICTTRLVAGAGMPQMSAIFECVQTGRDLGVPIIADGGIVTSGDVVKALAAGADAVMLGNMLAGVDEAPGDLELIDGAMFKTYRGMGSAGAMKGRAADRYGTAQSVGQARPGGGRGSCSLRRSSRRTRQPRDGRSPQRDGLCRSRHDSRSGPQRSTDPSHGRWAQREPSPRHHDDARLTGLRGVPSGVQPNG